VKEGERVLKVLLFLADFKPSKLLRCLTSHLIDDLLRRFNQLLNFFQRSDAPELRLLKTHADSHGAPTFE
jgi:hypothetical protein